MKHARMLFVFTCFILAGFPFITDALTFTLSDEAIMALDYNDFSSNWSSANILSITDVNGSGIQYDILFSDPLGISGKSSEMDRVSCTYGGNGTLIGRDISMFDAFALKFTFLSARGVSSPDAVGPVIVGSIITMPRDTWGFGLYWLAIDDLNKPRSVIAVTTTSARQIDFIGITCYIWWYHESYPNPWDPCGAIVSILVEPTPGAVVMTSDPNQVFQLVSIDKCTVAAGSIASGDKISFSGKMNPVYDNFYLTNVIQIAIGSDDMSDPCVVMIPINNADYKKTGKFSYSGTDVDGVKKSFKLDFKTHKFSFAAQNINLSGLSCPLNFGVDIADFIADTNVDETIVNGGKPISLKFLMGVKNSLHVDKSKFTMKSGVITQVAVSGGFSVEDLNNANLVTNPLDVNVGSQTFTIPAGKFKNTKGKCTCSNANISNGIASATFDFNKGMFTLTIKKTSFTASGTVNFNMEFGSFNEGAEISVP